MTMHQIITLGPAAAKLRKHHGDDLIRAYQSTPQIFWPPSKGLPVWNPTLWDPHYYEIEAGQ